MKKGLLLINLGTPSAPTAEAVKRYLKQFLSDPHVVNLPKILWQPILNGIILKTRPKKSAEAYQKVWTKRGSPLLVHAYDVAEKVEQSLNEKTTDDWSVTVGMSYGCPCIRNGMQKLKAMGCEEISILPLYPQYSTATTKSVYADIQDLLNQGVELPELKQIPPYYAHPAYITALADSIKNHWKEHPRNKKLMFSFHGLPQSYVDKGDPYQKQCVETTDLVVKELGLEDGEWVMTFQSRFGAAKWLQPYTDKTLEKLAKDGMSTIDTVCPGFAADCLETLEEIAIQNAELYYEHGGEKLVYIPALNASDQHAAMLAQLTLETGFELSKSKVSEHATG